MAISNNMATSQVSIVSLPLSKFPFSCLHVRSTGELCYRRLHHHHVARATGPLPCSLSSSIQPPLDVGVVQESQADKLIWEIREELGSIESRDLRGVDTLNDALLLVDLIQRLGVQRHFDHHINGMLHSIYREWREESGLVGPGITVLAFRLLRLNGFVVSADVIEALKDPNGGFSCFSIQTPRGVSDMLNLYRCSQTAFPSESNIMDEANQFARTQLSRALLLEEWDPLLQIDNLRREIEFALEYPRQCLLPRLESRSIVKQLWPGDGTINKCLELAKLDMEMLQKLHLKEIEELKRWWATLEVSELAFAERLRSGILKSHFAISTALFEPQFSMFRLAFAKTGCLITLVDDLFDLQCSKWQELTSFHEAVQRWDPSILDDLPRQRAIYMAVHNTMVELAYNSSKVQGHDLLPFFMNLWEDLVAAFAKEAAWKNKHHTPPLEDYMREAELSIAGATCILTSIFSMEELITKEALQSINKDSRFMHFVCVIARLCNDVATFKHEESVGETASFISCYMRDNPHCTQDEAITSARCNIESACREVELEHFKSRALVPECCSRVVLNFARTVCFLYKRADAFSNSSDVEYEMLVRDYYYDPLVHVQNNS